MAHHSKPDPEPLFTTLADCREAVAKTIKTKWIPNIADVVFKGIWEKGQVRKYQWTLKSDSIELHNITVASEKEHIKTCVTTTYIGTKNNYYYKSVTAEVFPFLWENFINDPTWLKYFEIKVVKSWFSETVVHIRAKETLLQGRNLGSLDDHLGNITTQEMTKELLDSVLKQAENLSLEQMLTSDIQEIRQLGLFLEKKR